MTTLVLKNIEDVDPISLEPIRDLTCIWLYRFRNDIFGYDAWEWLGYFCASGMLVHPTFKNELSTQDIHSLYLTCTKDSASTEPDKQTLLKQCESNRLHKFKRFDPQGNLIGVELRAFSPMKTYQFVELEDKYRTKKMDTKGIKNCTAKITYILYDHLGEPSSPYVLYM